MGRAHICGGHPIGGEGVYGHQSGLREQRGPEDGGLGGGEDRAQDGPGSFEGGRAAVQRRQGPVGRDPGFASSASLSHHGSRYLHPHVPHGRPAGTPEFVEHLRLLRDEVKDRVERGFAAVPEERYRLLWDNLPPWYDLRLFSDLAKQGANFVIDTYTQAWGPRYMGEIDTVDPLRSLAGYMGSGFLNVQVEKRYELLEELVDLYDVDGVVFHSDRSCKPFSLV